MAYEELGLRVDSVTWDLGALSEEMKKKDTFWLEKYNDLHETVTKMAHAMGVAIGIRNAKINEQAGYITHLKGNVDKLTEVCYTLSDKITTLEQESKEEWKAFKEAMVRRNEKINNNTKAYDEKIEKLEKAVNDFVEINRKQHKAMLDQLDLNSQTLEALQ